MGMARTGKARKGAARTRTAKKDKASETGLWPGLREMTDAH